MATAVPEKLRPFVPEVEWAMIADDIEAIERLKAEHDAVIRLDRLATGVNAASPEDVRDGLLEAADMVRTLWIVVDSGTRLNLTASG